MACSIPPRSISEKVKWAPLIDRWAVVSIKNKRIRLTDSYCNTESDILIEGVPFRLLFDYYQNNPRKHWAAMPPGFSYQTSQICPNPTKPLACNGFPFDRLMTPTSSLNPTELWCRSHVVKSLYGYHPYFNFSLQLRCREIRDKKVWNCRKM